MIIDYINSMIKKYDNKNYISNTILILYFTQVYLTINDYLVA